MILKYLNGNHFDSGKCGENLAVEYLKSNGYEVFVLNCRNKYWEVDIVSKNDISLVFFEVKSHPLMECQVTSWMKRNKNFNSSP